MAQHGGRGAGHQGGALSAAITNAGRPQGRCVGGCSPWENPLAANGPVSPFWAEAPMLESEAVPQDATPPVPPLMALLRECGARMSGLRLWPDGALILKIERNDAAMQVRLAGGDAIDWAQSAPMAASLGALPGDRPRQISHHQQSTQLNVLCSACCCYCTGPSRLPDGARG